MNRLLDTHALIWYLEESSELSRKATAIIDNPDIDVCVCAVSLWEIAIKMNLGKLKLMLSLKEFLDCIKTRSFRLIPIKDAHLLPLLALPYIHKDPFDSSSSPALCAGE